MQLLLWIHQLFDLYMFKLCSILCRILIIFNCQLSLYVIRNCLLNIITLASTCLDNFYLVRFHGGKNTPLFLFNLILVVCIIRLFYRGKFGLVFLVIDKVTKRQWAAKKIKCRASQKPDILNEIDVMNTLRHPKLVRLWEVFDHSREMVLIQE